MVMDDAKLVAEFEYILIIIMQSNTILLV